MTLPLWCLLGFVLWTLLLVHALAAWRVTLVLQGRAASNAFPADVPHGTDGYRRLIRAHLNCVENLPLFASVVLVGTFAAVDTPAFSTLAAVYLGARVAHSTIHLVSTSAPAVNLRFTALLVQMGCLVWMGIEIVLFVS